MTIPLESPYGLLAFRGFARRKRALAKENHFGDEENKLR